MLCPVADIHSLEDFGHFLFPLGSADVQIAKRKLYILIDIQLVDKVEALEHETDVSLAELRAVLLLEFCHLVSEKLVAAACRVVQQAEDVQKR